MLLLEQVITRKGQMDNALPEPKKNIEFEAGGNKKYEVKKIIDSAVYAQQTNSNDQISGLYYLVLWKGYPEKKNIWKPLSAVIYLQKLISTFHKEYLKKPTVTSLPRDSASPMARPSVPKEPKQKHSRQSKRANKRGRK